MADTPYVVESFGPLNLADDPEEVGVTGAVDMLDADLDLRGRVRCRDGYAKFTVPGPLGGVASSIASAPFTLYLLAWANATSGGGTVYALNASGASVASLNPGGTVAPMFLPGDPISLGAPSPTSGHILAFNAGTVAWSDADISTGVATSDTWRAIAKTPKSSRTVLTAGATKPDRVVFSDAGGNFSATSVNNWVEITVGDGDSTVGAANYRDKTIVFKGHKFAVFGDESVDGTGNPVFNYYMVNTGVGLSARLGTAVAPQGVYFMNRNGVYITQGADPVKVSGPIDPLFRGNPNALYTGSAISQQYIDNTRMAYYRERLYVAVTTGASTVNDRLLVFNPADNSWLVWSIPAASLCVHQPNATTFEEELMFGYATGTKDIGRHFRAYTTDAGSTISWQHSSGLADISASNRTAITRESTLRGSGSVALQVANDYGAFDAGSTLVLGTAPAVLETYQEVDREGRLWQVKVSGSGPASVNRLVHYISFVKPPGVQ